MAVLTLLVIRCKNIETSKQFYEKLQLDFVKEKHGNGSVHYSAISDGIVFELYPLLKKQQANVTDPIRLGFQVNNVTKHCVIIDPDGRKIDLYPRHLQ